MEVIENFFKSEIYTKIISSIVVIIIGIIVYNIFSHFLKKSEDKKVIKSNRKKTYIRLFRSIIRYVFMIIITLIVLQINGVNVSSLLAGIGIVGIVIGLAIQDWLKDIIRGISILSDDYFQVGDIVKYKEHEGKVIVIGLKTTKIQDLKTGNIKSIANRNIEEIDVVSDLVYLNIPMPYEVKVETAEKTVNRIVDNVKNNKYVTGCRYLSISELADSSINYLVEIKCDQNYKLQVRRDGIRTILTEMEKDGICVPYTQIDVHNK